MPTRRTVGTPTSTHPTMPEVSVMPTGTWIFRLNKPRTLLSIGTTQHSPHSTTNKLYNTHQLYRLFAGATCLPNPTPQHSARNMQASGVIPIPTHHLSSYPFLLGPKQGGCQAQCLDSTGTLYYINDIRYQYQSRRQLRPSYCASFALAKLTQAKLIGCTRLDSLLLDGKSDGIRLQSARRQCSFKRRVPLPVTY
jgi:hypothetical protein